LGESGRGIETRLATVRPAPRPMLFISASKTASRAQPPSSPAGLVPDGEQDQRKQHATRSAVESARSFPQQPPPRSGPGKTPDQPSRAAPDDQPHEGVPARDAASGPSRVPDLRGGSGRSLAAPQGLLAAGITVRRPGLGPPPPSGGVWGFRLGRGQSGQHRKTARSEKSRPDRRQQPDRRNELDTVLGPAG